MNCKSRISKCRIDYDSSQVITYSTWYLTPNNTRIQSFFRIAKRGRVVCWNLSSKYGNRRVRIFYKHPNKSQICRLFVVKRNAVLGIKIRCGGRSGDPALSTSANFKTEFSQNWYFVIFILGSRSERSKAIGRSSYCPTLSGRKK